MKGAAKPIIEPARAAPRFSWVWLVPILALAVALFVAWQTYADRGPLISITFPEASGMHAGETKLKYRDVDVGLVEKLTFSEDLKNVIAHVRVDPEVASFIDSESQFWIVKPTISAREVSGLQTVLSGVYIVGSWDGDKGASATEFAGLDHPPISRNGDNGLRVVLRAKDGNQLADGTPILHKGIEVGQVENPRLSDAGDGVLVDAFIRAPHDKLITTATRFWDASGFSFSLGAGGAKLDVESLAALVGGGISFDTLVSGGRKPSPGRIYDLFDSEDAVRNSIFSQPAGTAVSFGIVFDGTVAGLTAGAPVEYRGIKVGEVTNLSAEFVDSDTDFSAVRLIVIVGIDPGALGLDPDATISDVAGFLADAVTLGLRARLTTANILTGGLKVELAEIEGARPAQITTSDLPYPILPSVKAEISDVSASAEGVFKRLNDLPVEELLSSAITLLNSVNRLANDPDVAKTPAEVLGLIEDARNVVSSDAIAAIPDDVTEITASLKKAATDIEKLISQLSEDAVAMNLIEAIANANEATKNLRAASGGLPEIAEQINKLAAKADELPLDELVASTSELVRRVTEIAQSEAMEDLPPALSSALTEISGLTAKIREGSLIENANGAIVSAQQAADQIAAASNRLPALVDRLNKAAASAQTTLDGYGEKSRFTQNAMEMLKEVERAAEAVTSLARAIERNPNSIITGR